MRLLSTSAILCGAIAAALTGGALRANAGQIATFTVSSANPQFVYNAATPTSEGLFFTSTTGALPFGPIAGTFTFNAGPLAGIPLDAEMQMVGVTDTAVDDSEAPLLSQALADVTISVVGTDSVTDTDNGVSSATNLLSVDLADGLGTGTISGVNGSVVAGASGSQPGDTVALTSDILTDVSTYTSQAWNMVLNPVSPALGVTTPALAQPIVGDVDYEVPGSDYLNSFTAVAPDGISFSGTSSVPEPASLGLLGLGGLTLMLNRKRKIAR